MQLTFERGGVTYYLYTDGGGFAGTLDKTYPGTWWQIELDTGPTNAVTIYSSFGFQSYISNTAYIQVLDVNKQYPSRIWWYFYEAGIDSSSGATTYRIGNAQGKQVTLEFFSVNGVYTQAGATAFSIRPSIEPVPPEGTVDVRDKVGTGPLQLTYVSGGVTWYAYALNEGVGITVDKKHASTWWTVGNFDAGPARTAVTIYQSYTHSNLSNNRVVQAMNVNHKYDTRVWWYFYPTNDGTGAYKIGNALTKQVLYEFFSFSGSYTRDKATAWTLTGVTWDRYVTAGDDVASNSTSVASDSTELASEAASSSARVSLPAERLDVGGVTDM